MRPTKLPSGSWRCQVYVGKDPSGKRQYVSVTKPNKHDCIIEAEKIAKHHHEIKQDISNMTLAEAMKKYIEIKSNVLSPSTIRGYTVIKDNRFKNIQTIPLNKLTKSIIQNAINLEAADSSPKTIRNCYGFLTAVLNQFSDRQFDISLPQPIPFEGNILSEADLKRLIVAINGEEIEIPVLLALFLGLRRSEILALTYDDYDPVTKTININKALVPSVDKEYVLKTTKTVKSNRKISMPPYLAEKIEKRIQEGKPFCKGSSDHICRKLGKICEANNIPKIRLHDLRHQNASVMLALGISDKYAMERGGWSSTATMKNIYQHTMTSEKKLVDETINRYFEGLISQDAT